MDGMVVPSIVDQDGRGGSLESEDPLGDCALATFCAGRCAAYEFVPWSLDFFP